VNSARRKELDSADKSIKRDVGILAAIVFGVDPASGHWVDMIAGIGSVKSLSEAVSRTGLDEGDCISFQDELVSRIRREWTLPDPETAPVVARINNVLDNYRSEL
jgi:hypothetical protein